ncbi:MAG: ferrous iron transport protein A [Spirochaetales bacterium]|nr:ferrous iron transport protein A [Spirochaetales bacterium]
MNKTKIIKLSGLKPDEKAIISGYSQGKKEYRRKLLSFGLTPGTEITMKKAAPLGDPVEISLRGYSLSLRKAEAEVLELERKI